MLVKSFLCGKEWSACLDLNERAISIAEFLKLLYLIGYNARIFNKNQPERV